MPFDWQQFHAGSQDTPAVVDPRRRLRICLLGFVVGLLIVSGRIVQLEVTQGDGFRAVALQPVDKKTVLPAPRGRILARDGTPLACDQTIQSVAVHYRWLQEPPDAGWLSATARARLAKSDRRNAEKLVSSRAAVVAERTELAQRLAKLCGLSPDQWAARTRQIQARVERIAESANRRSQSVAAETDDADDSWALRMRRLLLEEPPTPRIVVAEELAHHVVADDVPQGVVAEIANHADRYPGVKVVDVSRRTYPNGPLAAHVIGHLAPIDEKELVAAQPAYRPDDWVGRIGVERQCEAVLRGRHGTAIERTDRGGRLLASFHPEEPIAGRDVTLTIDATLQRTAEELLQSAKQRGQNYLSTANAAEKNSSDPFSGAIVVMDVRDGAVRAAASMPAFDPNLFARAKTDEIAKLLADRTHPLFDRVCSMAIPPGSTFKVVTAAALLESSTIKPEEMFSCQGYLHQPDRQRCEIYVRQGIGHGDIALTDALAMSCNVYFFHFAGKMGPRPLVDWAERFGFGRPTGIDLPGEEAGILPSPELLRGKSTSWRVADTQSLAIGQGSLTVTPLQVLRMMAAVANGGRLVRPHVMQQGVGDRGQGTAGSGQGIGDSHKMNLRLPETHTSDPCPLSPVPCSLSLSSRNLKVIRDGLRRVVADPQGTAHATVYLDSTAIAGKTGTAETGEDQASHAWFAGYAPADDPKLAFVVVLEHAGEAAVAAGPLAKRLVLRMEQLGML
jgi:penicillin-binding protein 2